ncbi:MAG TPA: preprotein translocase subunit YajC, partial [Acidimicrobiales bacterium]|nr:preprotein translocase subunit YajC [Acidimicrobiales bacterium]
MATATLVSAVVMAASSSSKSTSSAGSSAASFIFLLVIVGLAVVFMRSRSANARRQRSTLMDLTAGDEVLTGAGIFGTVLDVEPDRVTLETAPGTRITVVRSTIARRITEPTAADLPEQDHGGDSGH